MMLSYLTPPQLTSRQAGAREVIFIIDTSGSMQGPRKFPFLARATGKAKSQAWIANATEGRGPG
jgi:hypothetical protein